LLPDRFLNIYAFFCGIYKFPSKSTRAIELTRKGVNPRKIYYDNRFYAWLVKIVPITGREEENKKVCFNASCFWPSRHLSSFLFLFFFLLFVYHCQQDFLSRWSYTKKGKRVITNPLLSFTFCVLVSSLILFSFPIFLWLAAFLCHFCFCFLTSRCKSLFAWFLLSRHYISILLCTYYY
jgi:hypothetical protein